ncbi:MAG: DUF3592 domain-containing protein [Pikeienuella sp.]
MMPTSPPPRPLPSFLAFGIRDALIVGGGIVALVGTVFFTVGMVMLAEERRFGAEGIQVTGTVLEKQSLRQRTSDGDYRRVYRVRYNFDWGYGPLLEGSSSVGARVYGELEEGGPVEIVFLESNPGENRLATGGSATAAIIFGVIGGLSATIGGTICAIGLRRVRRLRRILATGLPVEARVTAVEATNVTYNKVRLHRLLYAYEGPNGEHVTGRSRNRRPEAFGGLFPGAKTKVLTDRTAPHESVWAGDIELFRL